MPPIDNARRLVGAFVNTHPAQCSIYESGAMVEGCLEGSSMYDLHCVTLADIDLDALRDSHRLVSKAGTTPREFPARFDFWIFNWHFITMAGHIEPSTIASLPGFKFTIILELAEHDPLVLVPKGTFDGYLALDPLVREEGGVFAFPRPLQGAARSGVSHHRSIPLIGSFGFGTPGKGFEILTEAVNREFEQAVLRINVPIGDYISSQPGVARNYAEQMARNCRRIAKPGIDVQFSNEFRSPEAVIDWCHENDLNCFMYTRDQPGLSATTDQAILSGQPLLTLTNATFRHIHPYIPPYPLTSLREAMARTGSAVAAMQRDWSKVQFRSRFESMLARFVAVPRAEPGVVAAELSSGSTHNKRVRVLVVHRRDGTTGDVLSHGTRFVNAISRPATRDIRKAVCDTLVEALALIIGEQPDVVVVLDHTEEWCAQLAGCWDAQTRPFRLLKALSQPADAMLDAGPTPIVPFFTNPIPSPTTSVAWLLGFEPDDGHLYRWLARIASETRIDRIVVETVTEYIPVFKASVARFGALKRSDGTVVSVEVHSLPDGADDIVKQHLAVESVVICHASVDTLVRTEALCALALSTERAVILDAFAPLPSFGSALCLADDQSLQERIDQGIAGQIGVVCDFGEWATAARWLPRIDGSDDDANALSTSDVGSAVALSGLEHVDDDDFVRSVSQALLGRELEGDALELQLGALWDGRTRTEVASMIAQSTEALAGADGLISAGRAQPAPPIDLLQVYLHAWLEHLATLDNSAFVRAAYWAGLGRDADAGGLAGHEALIDGGESRLYVLHAIVASVEADFHGRQMAAGCVRLPGAAERGGMVGAAWIRYLSRLAPEAFRSAACGFFLGRSSQPGELQTEAAGSIHDRFSALEALRSSPEGEAWAVSCLSDGRAQRLRALSAATIRSSLRPSASDARMPAVADSARAERSPPAMPPSDRRHTVMWTLTASDESTMPGLVDRLLALRTCGPAYPVVWNPIARQLELLSASDGRASGMSLVNDLCRAGDWLVMSDGYGPRADGLPEVDVLMTARMLGLRSVCLFAEPVALRSEDGAARQAAFACERHVQALMLADLIVPISNAAHDVVTDLFAEHLLARDGPPIVKLPLPLSRDDDSGWGTFASKLRCLLARIDDESDSVPSVQLLDLRQKCDASARSPLATLLRRRGVDVEEVVLAHGRLVSADGSAPRPTAMPAPSWLVVDGAMSTSLQAVVHAHARAHDVRVAAISPASGPAFDFWPYLGFDRVVTSNAVEFQALQAQVLRTRERLPDAENRFVLIDRQGARSMQPRPRAIYRRVPGRRRIAVIAAGDHLEDRLAAVLDGIERAAMRSRCPVDLVVNVQNGAVAGSTLGRHFQACDVWFKALDIDAACDRADAVWVLGDSAFVAQAVDDAAWVGVPAVVALDAGSAPMPGVTVADASSSDAVEHLALRLLTDDLWLSALRNDALLRTPRTDDDHAGEVLRLLSRASAFRGLHAVRRSSRAGLGARFPALRRRPLLSVCISTYNRAGWLQLNLKNLFAQIGAMPDDDVEIVVVDNAATDETPRIVEPYLGKAKFHYYRNSVNVGMLGNLAVTAQRSNGSYVWIIGDDDLTQPDAVPSILAALKAHRHLAMIYLNYGYTSVDDPATVTDVAHHLANFNVLEPEGPNQLSTVAALAAHSENFYTAIYACVFQRAHALRAFCQDTSGRPFSSLLTCIPTAYYALHHMGTEPAYWIGKPALVVNSNVSWAPYGPLFDLEQLPRAWDLAECAGTSAAEVDARRSNRLWLVEIMWRDIFENDVADNSPYFSASRVLTRLKHLPAIDERVPALLSVYRRAHANGHPAASMTPETLFSAWPGLTDTTA